MPSRSKKTVKVTPFHRAIGLTLALGYNPDQPRDADGKFGSGGGGGPGLGRKSKGQMKKEAKGKALKEKMHAPKSESFQKMMTAQDKVSAANEEVLDLEDAVQIGPGWHQTTSGDKITSDELNSRINEARAAQKVAQKEYAAAHAEHVGQVKTQPYKDGSSSGNGGLAKPTGEMRASAKQADFPPENSMPIAKGPANTFFKTADGKIVKVSNKKIEKANQKVSGLTDAQKGKGLGGDAQGGYGGKPVSWENRNEFTNGEKAAIEKAGSIEAFKAQASKPFGKAPTAKEHTDSWLRGLKKGMKEDSSPKPSADESTKAWMRGLKKMDKASAQKEVMKKISGILGKKF
jgi:hypothetical protein